MKSRYLLFVGLSLAILGAEVPDGVYARGGARGKGINLISYADLEKTSKR